MERRIKILINIFLLSIFLSNLSLEGEDLLKKKNIENELLQLSKEVPPLVEKLTDPIASARRQAVQQLSKYGIKVIPFLCYELNKKGLSGYARLIENIYIANLKTKSSTIDEIISSEEIMKILQTRKPTINELKKIYLINKFTEIQKLYDNNSYEEVIRKINALKTLENNLPFQDRINALKIESEKKLIQQRITRAWFEINKTIYSANEVITCSLKIENVSLNPIKILVKNPELKTQEPRMKINVTITEYDAIGNYNSLTRERECIIPEDIELNPGKVWEKILKYDLKEFGLQEMPYRIYTFTAQLIPYRLVTQDSESIREIKFGRAVARSFPIKQESIKSFKQEPLKMFTKALNEGTYNDIFIASVLMPGKFKKSAVALLIPALKETTSNIKKIVYMNCLRHITKEPIGFNERRWVEWWNQQDKNK